MDGTKYAAKVKPPVCLIFLYLAVFQVYNFGDYDEQVAMADLETTMLKRLNHENFIKVIPSSFICQLFKLYLGVDMYQR